MAAKPLSPTSQAHSGFFSLSRVMMAVGVLGLSLGTTATSCIASRYNGATPGAKDGATESPADAAGPADAGTDAAPADGASDQGRSDGGASDGGASDGGPAVDAATDASAPSADPFDPGSCSAPALSSTQALALLGTMSRVKLADATLYRRERTCPTPTTCGAWSTPVVHQQSLLTYSGGVTTDYKTFTFPTHLIVFLQAGQAKWVIRHQSDYLHDATANTRGVGFSLGADPMENTYPVINVWDFAPAPSRYDDLAGLLGQKAQLHAAEHCARVIITTGMTVEIAALYKY